jgi:hypothetical protein
MTLKRDERQKSETVAGSVLPLDFNVDVYDCFCSSVLIFRLSIAVFKSCNHLFFSVGELNEKKENFDSENASAPRRMTHEVVMRIELSNRCRLSSAVVSERRRFRYLVQRGSTAPSCLYQRRFYISLSGYAHFWWHRKVGFLCVYSRRYK